MIRQVQSFEGQTAVITGRGLVALALAGAGATVHLIGRRLTSYNLLPFASAGQAGKPSATPATSRRTKDKVAVTKRIERELPGLNILIQNASTYLKRETRKCSFQKRPLTTPFL